MTSTRRPGAEKCSQHLYSLHIKNPTFRILDIDLRIGLYKGNYICKDLKNGEEYSFVYSPKKIKDELSKVKVGNLVSVCRFQGFDFFIASYQYSSERRIEKYYTVSQILLKRGASYKLTSAKLEKPYEICLLRGYYRSAESEYPTQGSLDLDLCEEVKAAYGFVTVFGKEEEKEVIFTNIVNSKSYLVPRHSVHDDDFQALCKNTYIMKAYVSISGSGLARLEKAYKTGKYGILEYGFSHNKNAYCMDRETQDVFIIPQRYIPKGIKVGDWLTGVAAVDEELKAIDPTGKVHVLHKVYKR